MSPKRKTTNMRKLLILIIFVFCAGIGRAQEVYRKTFGQPGNTPLIFLHGGPGGSAIDFELTTAEKLADRGFFVILYDRRGEGRSDDDKAGFTFEQTFDDLQEIYRVYGLRSAVILGHSFGGVVGTRFAARYPEKVSHLVLAGAPVSLQQCFKTILRTVQKKAEAKGDSATLTQVDFVRKQDTASVYYSSGSFMLAMQNGIYKAENASQDAVKLMEGFMQHPLTKAYMDNQAKTNYKNMYASVMGFINHEKYTTIDLADDLRNRDGIRLYGIYGRQDGLFDDAHIALIRSLVKEPSHFAYLDNCSHSVYIDRQEEFINKLVAWLK